MTFNAKDIQHPPAKGVVRAELKVQAAILTRTPDNKTKYINCSMIHPKANAPMFLMRGQLKDASLISLKFKTEVEKDLKTKF